MMTMMRSVAISLDEGFTTANLLSTCRTFRTKHTFHNERYAQICYLSKRLPLAVDTCACVAVRD